MNISRKNRAILRQVTKEYEIQASRESVEELKDKLDKLWLLLVKEACERVKKENGKRLLARHI